MRARFRGRPSRAIAPSGTGTFQLSWAAAINDAGGNSPGTVTGYRVYYDTVSRIPGGGTYAYSQFVAGSGATSLTLTGLLNLTTYYTTVVTVYASGDPSIADYEVSYTTS